MHNMEIDIGINAWTKRGEISIYLVKKKYIDLTSFNFYVFYDEMTYKEHANEFTNKLSNKLFDYIEGVRK